MVDLTQKLQIIGAAIKAVRRRPSLSSGTISFASNRTLSSRKRGARGIRSTHISRQLVKCAAYPFFNAPVQPDRAAQRPLLDGCTSSCHKSEEWRSAAGLAELQPTPRRAGIMTTRNGMTTTIHLGWSKDRNTSHESRFTAADSYRQQSL